MEVSRNIQVECHFIKKIGGSYVFSCFDTEQDVFFVGVVNPWEWSATMSGLSHNPRTRMYINQYSPVTFNQGVIDMLLEHLRWKCPTKPATKFNRH